jgi:hypothetical protein
MLGGWLPLLWQNLSSIGPSIPTFLMSASYVIQSGITTENSPAGYLLEPLAGNVVECTWTLRDDTGNLYDPGNVYVFTHSPSTPFVPGVTTQISVTRVSTGVYMAHFIPATAGTWTMRLADATLPPNNSSLVSEATFTVYPLAFS